jgi:hypothetical protein
MPSNVLTTDNRQSSTTKIEDDAFVAKVRTVYYASTKNELLNVD